MWLYLPIARITQIAPPNYPAANDDQTEPVDDTPTDDDEDNGE